MVTLLNPYIGTIVEDNFISSTYIIANNAMSGLGHFGSVFLCKGPSEILMATSGGTSTNRPKKRVPARIDSLKKKSSLDIILCKISPLSEINSVAHASVGLGHWSHRDIGVEIG